MHVIWLVASQRVQRMKKQRGSPWVAVARDDHVQGASLFGLEDTNCLTTAQKLSVVQAAMHCCAS
eukprot:scaffold76023_cov81-Phaeocystis_antarctica.AAC.1